MTGLLIEGHCPIRREQVRSLRHFIRQVTHPRLDGKAAKPGEAINVMAYLGKTLVSSDSLPTRCSARNYLEAALVLIEESKPYVDVTDRAIQVADVFACLAKADLDTQPATEMLKGLISTIDAEIRTIKNRFTKPWNIQDAEPLRLRLEDLIQAKRGVQFLTGIENWD